MTRAKRGVVANKRRHRLLKNTKGFLWGRKSKYRTAKEALLHAWSFQFADRKVKKRNFRRLWQTRIGAAAKASGTSYPRLIDQLPKANIELDRKVLSQLAAQHPEVFSQILATK